MIKKIALIAVFAGLFLVPGSSSLFAGEPTGKELVELACKAAEAKKSLVLLKFSAEWCPWCVDMKKIFQEPSMVAALQGYELVDLDVGKRVVVDGKKQYEKNYDLMQSYVEKVFIPQLIILDAKGKIVARLNSDDYEKKDPDGNDPEKLSKILLKYKTVARP